MGDSELRAELEQHHQQALGWALSCCGWNRALAEEVLQGAYLKVLEGRARFEGRSSFKTWLFAVIRRTAAEHRRRQALQRFVPLSLLDGRSDSALRNPEVDLLRSESSAQLIRALQALPERQRQLLHLVFYQDLTIREAAEVLGVSIGTARTHYERGKQRLRETLGWSTDDER